MDEDKVRIRNGINQDYAKAQHQLFVHQLVHWRLKEVTATTIGRWNHILLLALAPTVRD